VKVLIADDDRVLADVVSFTLRREGFQVSLAYDGQAALQRWVDEKPDLIILDVNMPKLDGFEVCRRIRAQSDTPILLLTVRGEEDDIVYGLGLGADDYITKPFSPRQLVARAQAVLRRSGKTPTPAVRQVGTLTLDPNRREITVGAGQPVSLTPLENRLLDYDRDMLRQLVRRLRLKINQACGTSPTDPELDAPLYIDTVPGLGYGLMISSTE
jgi:DNA-binding response OmpR family regulator